MEKRSIFGLEPDQLDEILSAITGDFDGTELEKAKSSSQDDANPSKKSQLAGITVSLHGSIEQPGSQIGRYKLLHVLGEGGMGIVYLAEQKHPIRRQVALKVIKPGMDSKRVIARFEAERQALALLDHPNIAHVHDAGTTEAGRPYFVMEYVKGLPITEHCDRHKLSIEDRLNLFRQVCLAVNHAHQKGIIHRDIKPSNILVSTQDDKAVPKIIDFGVAKAIVQPLTERTLATEDSQLLGTPEYMSPEQADMATEDIDTRSDIYSLGVLLYVLLTGVLPFDSDTLRTGGIERIRQIIRETDPKTPSTRLTNLGEEAKKVAQSRRTEVVTLAKKLHKELEWIPLKAMRKGRSERYRSASELADDIENYLKGAPLIAGPLTAAYRLKKFVRRNHTLVTGIISVVVALTAGLIVSTALYFRAERASAEAQMIADFLKNDVLSSAGKIKGREATVRDLFNAASKNLEDRFVNEPLVEASIRETLGNITWLDLGDYRASMLHRERAYRIYLEQLGEEHGRTRAAKNMLAVSYFFGGRYREAEAFYEQVIEGAHRQKSRELTDHMPAWRCNLATTYGAQGRYEEAEELLRTTLESDEWDRDFWPESECMVQYGHELGEIYRKQGRYKEAEQLYLIALENKSIRYPAWCTVRSLNGLARLRLAQKRYPEAEDLFTKGIEIGNRELPGKDHPLTLRNINGLAVLRTRQQRYEEAEILFEQVLAGSKLKLGEDHPETLETKNDLAILYREQGDYDNAEILLLEALEGRRLKLGDTHPHTIESINNLIELYKACNKPEQANQWRAKLPQPNPPR